MYMGWVSPCVHDRDIPDGLWNKTQNITIYRILQALFEYARKWHAHCFVIK